MSREEEPIVFVVDDDEAVCQGMDALLQSVGLKTETFSSPADFLRRPRTSVPCCLVLDVRLPWMSGIELQRRLALEDVDIPIIFITGHGDVPMSVEAMKAGAVEFLTKPVRGQEVLDAIHGALALSRERLENRSKQTDLRKRLDANKVSLTQIQIPRRSRFARRNRASPPGKRRASPQGMERVVEPAHRAAQLQAGIAETKVGEVDKSTDQTPEADIARYVVLDVLASVPPFEGLRGVGKTRGLTSVDRLAGCRVGMLRSQQ